MNKKRGLPIALAVLAMVFGLGACQTWYKPGAGGDQLASDQALCESQAGSRSAPSFADCMQAEGWSRVDTAPPATDSASKPVRSGVAVTATKTRAVEKQPTSIKSSHSTEITVGTTHEPSHVAHVVPGAWFKYGANTRELELDKQACTPAGASDPDYACMYDRGWRAVGKRLEQR